MKKALFFCLITLPACLLAQSIQNNDFEQLTTQKDSLFAHWRISVGTSCSIDSTLKIKGKYAAIIQHDSTTTYGAITQNIPLTQNQVLYWQLTARVRVEGEEESFASLFVSTLKGKKRVSFVDMDKEVIKEKKLWREAKLEFFTTPEMDKMVIGGLIDGEGRAWFDAFTLTQLPLDARKSQATKEAKKYMKLAFQHIENNSIRKDSVDFVKLKNTTNLLISKAKTTEDCYPAVEYVLGQLGDNHSFLMKPQAAEEWVKPAETQSPETKAKTVSGFGVYMEKQFAYIQMPAFSSGNVEVCQTYADSLQSIIRSLDNQEIKGWVLDLRQNQGGNCWPMLLGIAPLLGNGKYGYFVDGNQKRYAWFHTNGKVGLDNGTLLKLPHKSYVLKHQNLPIAVLTGDKTASSGEVVTVAFRAVQNVRSFGSPTHGLSTGNSSFDMKDGSRIFLTTSIYADRTGKLYGGKILPDVTIPNANEIKANDFRNDETLKQAKTWILGLGEEK
ncbi:MAG: S41 family peptidase [Bacteroidia bacterium]